jgi:Family of unknown function (DUF5995)
MNSDSGTRETRDEGSPCRGSSGKVVGPSSQPAPAPPRLEPVQTIADVARNIDRILDWSIEAQSTIGYFAALYKRVTVAIGDAIDDGVFDDGPRMERLDVAFARRYFNALNAYFYPGEYDELTLPWEVAFVGDKNDNQSTMLQHMLTGLNAHITFDLGLAAVAIAPDSLAALETDFNRVNAVLCSQIPGMLDVVQQLSPVVRQIRRVVPNEVGLLKRMLMKLRQSAWYFAVFSALHPEHAREKRVNQQSWTAALGAWYLQPPARLTAFPVLVRAIAKRESRDVGKNILALQGVSNTPVKMTRAYL